MIKRLLALLALAGGLMTHVHAQTYPGVSQCLNIMSPPFGAVGNNSNDTAPALNAAFSALTGTGGCIYFPPGKYKFNSAPSFSHPAGVFSVGIYGGGQDETILTWPAGSGGIAFNYAGAGSSVHIRDLSLTTGTTNGGAAISLANTTSNANPAITANSDLYRVTCRGDDGYGLTDYWTFCVNVANVSNIQFESLFVQGPSTSNGTGVNLLGLPGSSTYGVVYNFGKSTFNQLTSGITYGSFIQGVTIEECNFTSGAAGASTGITVPAAQTGILDELFVVNSQFAVSSSAIALSTAMNHFEVANSYFISRANSTGIVEVNGVGVTLTGNSFFASSTTGTNAIVLGTTTTGATVAGNFIDGYGVGITLQTSDTGIVVSGNTLIANSTAITNGSAATTNFIVNNSGYNPVGTSSATYAPASTATYTAGASPETSYLTGGTVTAVKVPNNAGTTICTTTPCTIDLGPNETFSVTYTGAPTQTKSVH